MHAIPLPSLQSAIHAPSWWWIVAGLVLLFLVLRLRAVRAIVSLGLIVMLVVFASAGYRDSPRLHPWLDRLGGGIDRTDQQVVGQDLRIKLSPDGHFWARARIDGVERRMLIDSGATITALSPRTAAAAGIAIDQDAPPVILNTANGATTGRVGRIADLRLGRIAARGLTVVVSPGFGDTDVLGMNFLSRLKSWRVEENVLVMTPHHPVADG